MICNYGGGGKREKGDPGSALRSTACGQRVPDRHSKEVSVPELARSSNALGFYQPILNMPVSPW